MVATLEYVKRKFDEFNSLIFEGALQPLPFRLSRARTFLGQIKYTRRRRLLGGVRYSDFQFVISNATDLPESEIEDTIIHEMIHYWILSNQMQDTSPHGSIFKSKMNEINRRFHRHVTISHRMTQEVAGQNQTIRQHLLCVVRLDNGQTGITLAVKSRLFQLWNELPRCSGVVQCRWYSSLDPFFNRYPRSLSPKVYPITPAELNDHLRDAIPLVREGNTIHAAPMH